MEKSRRIININLVLTLFIVLLHSIVNPKSIKECPIQYSELVNSFYVLFDTAVPTFFAISAFLLFRSLKYKNYTDKLKSRFKSLIIPYLIFSICTAIFWGVGRSIKGTGGGTSMMDMIIGVYYAKWDSPIWYLRTLFYYVLLSPFILLLIQKTGKIGVVVIVLLGFVLNYYIHMTYDIFIFWIPILVLFSFLGHEFPESIYTKEIFKKKVVSYAFVIVALVIAFLLRDIDKRSFVYYVYRMFAPCLLIGISDLFVWKKSIFDGKTFFIFMIHMEVVMLIQHLVGTNISWSYDLLLIPIIVIAVSFVLSDICKSVLPQRLWALINGNRIK